MEANRRRQNRSCDQCRKGKKACDAAVREDTRKSNNKAQSPSTSHGSPDSASPAPCTNCKRWKKDCTFHWLHSIQRNTRERSWKKIRRDESSRPLEASPTSKDDSHPWRACEVFGQTPINDSPGGRSFQGYDDSALPALRLSEKESYPGLMEAQPLGLNATGALSWDTNSTDISLSDGDMNSMHASPEVIHTWPVYESPLSNSLPNVWTNASDILGHSDDSGQDMSTLNSSSRDLGLIDSSRTYLHYLSDQNIPTQKSHAASINKPQPYPFLCSSNLVEEFTRSATSQNFFRIYHDSLENALSCWLTEQNCPYSSVTTPGMRRKNALLDGVIKEWGPNWSNRICMRVCRLDRAYAVGSGRRLSDQEEKMASRTLHTAIMAFASQWAHDHQGKMRHLNNQLSSIDHSERQVQKDLWNQARNNLHASGGISSFRIAFANIIFSLTQPPLDVAEHIQKLDLSATEVGDHLKPSRSSTDPCTTFSGVVELDDLIENDSAPLFLDAALRQLFSFRYKLTQRQRQRAAFSTNRKNMSTKPYSHSTPQSQNFDMQQQAPQKCTQTVPTSLLSPPDQETFNLLLWLGIMFDTLTSVMYQRPVVISDEDSQITSVVPPSASHTCQSEEEQIDLDGWSMNSALLGRKKLGVWGDLFLERRNIGLGTSVARWPCSHEEAAKILSDAAPVKVLLFRRVSRLQTLINRGAEPEHLEEAIQETLRVYHHWNCTYRQFIVDCIAHHDNLPHRIQSWYFILAGHWHLAAMLLADTLESIDLAHLGLDTQRETRRVMGLASTLSRDNALAVCSLAECSLQGVNLQTSKTSQFHDSLDQGAFLTEPWTVVLIRSFTKAGSIILNDVYLSPHTTHLQKNHQPSEYARRQCGFCIDALRCLGRKSDMAFVAAHALSKAFDRKLMQRDMSYL
ncbi:hypothetical protein AJ80_01857 [Polytolypa hystricis UAMH7299]|uniref:Zn(2)-C6 fungal-type domain-containing protein n=1 Tax=Polytolypa hystricis (strain UAMH7299) TaxID=1447883 RepID=A0A2B7YZZ6_POLH7|nr:hypothetical protein AJ80_01857 [Polytolypa hystricis UAMH7299]